MLHDAPCICGNSWDLSEGWWALIRAGEAFNYQVLQVGGLGQTLRNSGPLHGTWASRPAPDSHTTAAEERRCASRTCSRLRFRDVGGAGGSLVGRLCVQELDFEKLGFRIASAV